MARDIRLYSFGDEKGVEVCDHIELPDAAEKSDHSEYIETLDIRCTECDETYSFTVLVN